MSLPLMRLPSPYSSDRLVQLAARLWPALCDTLITVGLQEFPVHSLVLAGVSQQLAHRGRWALGDGISPSTFAQLLHFVYGESVELKPGELGALEAAARALGVQSLEEACRRARRDRAQEQQDAALKKHQEDSEKPLRESQRELWDLGEKQKQGFFKAGSREQEPLHKHGPLGESPETAGARQEGPGEQTRSKEKLSQSSDGHGGREGKPGATMGLREHLGGSEDSPWESPSPLAPPSSLQANAISRPWWVEAPWFGGGQPALQSILLLPPSYGASFSHSTPATGAWQEVWPREQRIPLPLNRQKGLWSQDLLASSSPSPGSIAACVGHNGKAGRLSHQHPSLPSPTRVRPFSCPVCGKRFSLKHQMETHYRVHTD